MHGAGPPVLLIPGLSCDGEVWDETVAVLDGDYQVHVLSLAGFAGRAAIEAPFLPRVGDDIVAYIRASQLDHPAVVGHSLGVVQLRGSTTPRSSVTASAASWRSGWQPANRPLSDRSSPSTVCRSCPL